MLAPRFFKKKGPDFLSPDDIEICDAFLRGERDFFIDNNFGWAAITEHLNNISFFRGDVGRNKQLFFDLDIFTDCIENRCEVAELEFVLLEGICSRLGIPIYL